MESSVIVPPLPPETALAVAMELRPEISVLERVTAPVRPATVVTGAAAQLIREVDRVPDVILDASRLGISEGTRVRKKGAPAVGPTLGPAKTKNG
jgi:hypothetical protein